jgi:hypothetical protein
MSTMPFLFGSKALRREITIMKTSTLTLLLAIAVGLATSIISDSAQAVIIPASIIWGPATSIHGDTDVSTLGTRVAAYNLSDSAELQPALVNGVQFDPFGIPSNANTKTATVGNFVLTESPGFLEGASIFGSSLHPYVALSSNYQVILESAAYANDLTTLTLTMNALSIGQQYQFEWWINDSSDDPNYTTAATAVNSVSLSDNPSNAQGGTGQFAIGTFTATATTHTIAFSGTLDEPTINAFELRAVPEPSTFVLGVAGMAGLGLVTRRKRLRRA